MKGFFDLTPDNVSKENLERAKQLKAIIPRGKMHKFSGINKWAEDFQALEDEDGADPVDVDAVLVWLATNFDKQHTPRFFSASGFRKKFKALRLAMQRDPGSGVELEITGETKRLLDGEMKWWEWPKDSEGQVQQVVQRSINEHHELRRRLLALQAKVTNYSLRIDRRKQDDLKRFLEVVIHHKLEGASTFAHNWMLNVLKMVQRWDDWNGDLVALRFTVGSKKFQQMGHGWAMSYCGDSKRWDLLMEQLKHA